MKWLLKLGSDHQSLPIFFTVAVIDPYAYHTFKRYHQSILHLMASQNFVFFY